MIQVPLWPGSLVKRTIKENNIASITKIKDRLYDIVCLDYDSPTKYMDNKYGCSAVRKGNFYGRNYDWYYNNNTGFIVHTPNANGRYATIGIASTSLTLEQVESGEYQEIYKILPHFVLDGINEKGVICNDNVLPNDKGYTTGTNPSKKKIHGMAIVRYILDYADSVDTALKLLEERNIVFPHGKILDNELHFMIADSTKTVVVEIINNEIKVIDEFVNDVAAMTNFYLYEFDGNTCTNYSGNKGSQSYSPTGTTLTSHAQGIERYDIITSAYPSLSTEADMVNLMKSLYYTKAYTNTTNIWYSEFLAEYSDGTNLTIDSTLPQVEAKMANIYQGKSVKDLYDERSRDTGMTWETVHTSIYDIENKTLKLYSEEGTEPVYVGTVKTIIL